MKQSDISHSQNTTPSQTHHFSNSDRAQDVYLRTTSGESTIFENISQNLMVRLSQKFDILEKSTDTQRIKI
jgi:hypothetical protein